MVSQVLARPWYNEYEMFLLQHHRFASAAQTPLLQTETVLVICYGDCFGIVMCLIQ